VTTHMPAHMVRVTTRGRHWVGVISAGVALLMAVTSAFATTSCAEKCMTEEKTCETRAPDIERATDCVDTGLECIERCKTALLGTKRVSCPDRCKADHNACVGRAGGSLLAAYDCAQAGKRCLAKCKQ
jgi:hypothetical protein